jgi:hypothetical protein
MTPPRLVLLALLPLTLAGRCGPHVVEPDTQDTDSTPGQQAAEGLSVAVHGTIGSILVTSWEQLEACTGVVAYRIDDEESWASSPVKILEPGAQEQLILGVPYAAEVELRLEQDCAEGAWSSRSVSAQADPLPDGLPHAGLISAVDGAWDSSWPYILTSIDSRNDHSDPDQTWTIILDRAGRTVWALPTQAFRITMAPRVAIDGASLLLDQNSFWYIFDGGVASQVLRVDLLGNELELFDTPGLHHPFTELPDGTIAWGAAQGMTETIELLDPTTREQRSLWSCYGFHQQVGSMQPCSANTLNWSEARGSYLISFFSTDSVVEVDDTSGESLRWFGHLPDSYAFDPEESAFYWQHGTNFTDDGTLLVSTLNGEPGDESLVREYELDDGAHTLRQVWSFGEGEGVYGYELGEAWRLPNGDTMHNIGTAQRLREISPGGEVVWDLGWTRGSYIGRSTGIQDLYGLVE